MSCLGFTAVSTLYLSKNLAFLLRKYGLNPNSLSELNPELKQPTTRRLLLGESQNPRQPTVQQYADHFGYSVGDMLYKDLEFDGLENLIGTGDSVGGLTRVEKLLPVLSWVQAGVWTGAEQVHMHDVTEFFPAFSETSDQSFYLKVVGLSNFPEYVEGDYICVDPTYQIDELHTGDMVVISRGGDATFKMLIVESDGKKYLKPLNRDFSPQIIELDDSCRLIGLVTGVYRPVKRRRMTA